MTPQPSRSAGSLRALGRGAFYLLLIVEALFLLVLAIVDPTTRWIIASLVPVYYLAVAVHEMGHLIGGRLVGFRFRFVTVGPLKVARQGKRLRLSSAGRRLWLGGLAASFPADYHDLRRRTAVMIAGGPAASFLQTLVTAGSVAAWNAHIAALGAVPSGEWWVGGSLRYAEAVAAVLFVSNILPLKIRGLMTDGARLLLLWRGGERAERYCALTILSGMAIAGLRPRDWPDDLLERADALADASEFTVAVAIMRYYQALDRGEVDAAGAQLDRALAALEKHPVVFRPAYFLEAAYFTARHRGDTAAARAQLKQSKGAVLVEAYTRLRAEAAVLLAEGNRETARARALEGLTAIERARSQETAVAEADWLREIVSLAAANPARSSAPD